jgi:CspA family cold shock protein
MPKGTVKWFNPAKGYGFIQPTGGGGKDVLARVQDISQVGGRVLADAQSHPDAK